ncbi:biotin/lipoyl-containing protein [Microbispora hainanensis]|uniref:biotin/lipoyl-containing protein n=1 Tax=Microbispora hainanensis TaxID=568844 RepID=UPI0033D44F18
MAELRVPKLNNNDTEYLLVEWLAADGAQVAEDDAVALVETSKAAEELIADAAGVLRHRLRQGVWCRPDDVIAVIGDVPEPPEFDAASSVPAAQDAVARGAGQRGVEQRSAGDEPAPLITAPAQALIDELGIGLDRVRALGVAVVRRADVERLAATPPGGETRGEHRLSRVQRAVARSVELSRRTIPAAYAVVRMDLGPALEHARATTREIRRPVGSRRCSSRPSRACTSGSHCSSPP